MSRKEVVPYSTDERIIFPFKSKTRSFSLESYSPNLTDGRVSSKEISHVLEELKIAILPLIKLMKRVTAGFVAAFFLLITLFTLFMTLEAPGKKGYTVWGIIGFVIATALPSLLFFKLALLNSKKSKEVSQVVLDKWNSEYARKGLRWRLPQQYPKWIELWNEVQRDSSSELSQSVTTIPMFGQTASSFGISNQIENPFGQRTRDNFRNNNRRAVSRGGQIEIPKAFKDVDDIVFLGESFEEKTK